MSVLGERAYLDPCPVERLGFSFVFSSQPALTKTETGWCAVHTSTWSFWGYFGFAWSISSQKGSSDGHERWTKSGSLTWGKRSPACAALHCSQADLLLSGACTKLRSGVCFGQGVGGLRAIGPAGILGDLEIAFGYRLGNTVQMRTLHFFPTWSCCNLSTQTLGLGRKEQIKMCSSYVLIFPEGAVPIWWA